MKNLEEVAEELSAIGQGVCNEVGISELFIVSAPKGMTDHYAFTGFLGETPLFFGINGRGNKVREYIPEILDAIKKHLETTH